MQKAGGMSLRLYFYFSAPQASSASARAAIASSSAGFIAVRMVTSGATISMSFMPSRYAPISFVEGGAPGPEGGVGCPRRARAEAA